MSTFPTRSKIAIVTYLPLVIGIACIGLGAYYFTTKTSFLASDFGSHPTHGIGSTGLGIALIVAAIIGWRKAWKNSAAATRPPKG